MKRIPIFYNTIVLLILCSNIIVFFSFIYILLDILDIGRIIEHHTAPYNGPEWFDNLTRTLYFSAITLLSVGYGDITPFGWSRAVAIFEALVGYILPAVITVQYLRLFPATIENIFHFLNPRMDKKNNQK